MNTKRIGTALALLCIVTAPGFALERRSSSQDDAEKKQDTSLIEAAAAKKLAARPLSIAITGLSKDNTSKIVKEIKDITHSIFTCSKCDEEYTKKGECCDAELEEKRHKVADSVMADVDDKQLSVTLNEDQILRLTELEAALKDLDVRIDRKELRLPVYFEVTVAGVLSEKQASSLQEALKEAGLAEPLTHELDKDAKRVTLRARTLDSEASYERLSKLIKEENRSAHVEDLTWAGACSACRKAGMKQAACPKCLPNAKKKARTS